MKTFSAEEFNKNPYKVYREADRNGAAAINHLHYKDKVFVISTKERGEEHTQCPLPRHNPESD